MTRSVPTSEVFAQGRAFFQHIEHWLCSEEATESTHWELEERLTVDGRELMRELLQAHLRYRALQEPRNDTVIGSDGKRRTHVEASERGLMTVFGGVRVPRLAYGGREVGDLHVADAGLNLPVETHSHGLRREASEEVAKGSYDEAVASIEKHTGARVGKRQVEELVVRAAQDFDLFYDSGLARSPRGSASDLLVLSMDGKGIVMRPEGLREATRKAAAASHPKLNRRLSRGEKRNRKRMATVAAVYSVAPFVRTPEDVLGDLDGVPLAAKPRPRAHQKRVWASVEKDAETVTREVFEEAERRDGKHRRTWVVLVDGDRHQITRIANEARRCHVKVTFVLDLIHVLEYLWKAAWCFFEEGDPEVESWVTERATAILAGKSSDVAGGIRRSATLRELPDKERKGADSCADYLLAKRPLLHYDEYLAAGFPISTGVIEGACRHLINDRLDITGARWSVGGAEAVLRLRSLRSSGDLDDYWRLHLRRELERNHLSKYADYALPEAA